MKFNVFKKTVAQTVNHEGAVAYTTSAELELYTAVVTASLSNTFYEKENERLQRIINLINRVEPSFVARLAVYCREQMYLRSVPLVLITELSKSHNGDGLVGQTTQRVIQRADEITELLAYYQLSNLRTGDKQLNKLSKQVQKGLAQAFNKFDEYQFAKYNRKTTVTFKDALFLTHPKAVSEAQQQVFDRIVNDALETPYTWEVELSAIGQEEYKDASDKARAIKRKWEELIDSGKLGYMALLRNLRNILQAKVSSDAIRKVGEHLADPVAVRRSKQLPFRFLAAYKELEPLKLNYVSWLMDSLEEAINISAENISGFDLNTKLLIAADVSGSMYQAVSARSKIRCYDIGLVLSMLLASKSKNVVTGIFGDRWKEVNMSRSNILSNVRKLDSMEGSVGYSTNGHLVIDSLTRARRKMDKVMFFTDLQMWDSTSRSGHIANSWKEYKVKVAPQARLYLFDLAGYGNVPLQVKRNDVFLIAGWSDKIFDVLAAIEEGGDALDKIKRIEI
ncbi:MAG: TROVE domain-containing protein [Roseivirga sp.]|nr:TROVE domain-containing protein [Roseivirga sp.]